MTQYRRPKRAVDGVVLLDKPLGVSSNGALQQARRLYQAAKGGHTGVLDPLATGLLPLCFGEATKFCAYLLEADKAYRATLQFGANTTTGDSEGEIILRRTPAFDEAALRAALQRFTGPQSQVPPMYSALKHQGRPLYEYARQGIHIERPARQITIYEIDLVTFSGDTAVLDVRCSKGTYIRTLAEDLGEALGCGAHLTGLRRRQTAGFIVEQCITLPQLETLSGDERDALLLPAEVLVSHLPEIRLPQPDAARFCHGQTLRIEASYGIMQRFRVYAESGAKTFLGLGEIGQDNCLHPLRLMATA